MNALKLSNLKENNFQKLRTWKFLLVAVAVLIPALCIFYRPSRPIGKEQAIAAAIKEAQEKGWTVDDWGSDALFTNGFWEVALWGMPPFPIRTGAEGIMRLDFNVAMNGQISPYLPVKPSGPPITQEQAIDAAKKWADKRGQKVIRIDSASFDDDHWEVGLWTFNGPGGFVSLIIATNGRVTAYHPSE